MVRQVAGPVLPARSHHVSATAVAVLLAITAASIGLWALTSQLVVAEERQVLEKRTEEVRAAVTARLDALRTLLSALGSAIAADPHPESVEGVLASVITPQGLSAVALVDTTGPTPQVRAAAGNGPLLGPEAVDTLGRLSESEPLAVSGVIGQGADRRLGFAQRPTGVQPGQAIYGEIALDSYDPALVRSVLGDTPDVDSALFAGNQARPDAVLFSTTRAIPFDPPVVSSLLPVGSSTVLLQTHSRVPLVSGIAVSVPWILLVGGIITAVLLAAIVEILARRRDDALALADAQARESMSILDAAREAFMSFDGDRRVTDWSDQAEQLLGWSADQMLGRHIVETIVPPELRDRYDRSLDRLLREDADDRPRRFEAEVVTREGRRFPVEVSIWRSQKHPGGANTIMHDITERRRAADELAAAHDQALEASRLKSSFVATMSHEIRTPMNAIIGMTGLLLRTRLDGEQREYAETVRGSAGALLTLVNDILDFSKIEAGRLELELVDFDLRTIVEDVADLLAEQAHGKGLELITVIDTEVPAMVCGDPGRLRQVLVNLVGNAVKFTDAGEVVIACSVAGPRGERDILRFEVRDTGCGIPPDQLDGLFASFTQLDSSTTRRYGGTGLGLTIARQLTELMGGEIGSSSAVGEGSTFWFTAEVRAPEKAPEAVAPGTLPAGTRVLVVDDNATTRSGLAALLADAGAAPTEAADADEAVRAVRRATSEGRPYELALLDNRMPGTDVIALAHRLQSRAGGEGTRIILLTSTGPPIDKAQLDAVGIVGVLAKPVRRQALRSRILEALGPAPATTPAPAVETIEAPAAAGTRVLVAEDNPVNQRVAQRMLEKLGCIVDIVPNGREAVEAALQGDYAMVFMDGQMPEMDGYEATREIRRREPAGRRTPVVAMTASAMKGDRERALAAGMDDYVAKPVDLAVLSAAVSRWSPTPANRAGTGRGAIDLTAIDELRAQARTSGGSGPSAVERRERGS